MITIRDVVTSALGLCCLQLSEREPLVMVSIELDRPYPATGGKQLLPSSLGGGQEHLGAPCSPV